MMCGSIEPKMDVVHVGPTIVPCTKQGLHLELRRPDKTLGPTSGLDQCVVWDAYLGGCHIGYAALEPCSGEFDAVLGRFGPAVRLHISHQYRGRGLGSAVARAFFDELKRCRYSQPLFTSHRTDDDAAAHLLVKLGFLYTGPRTLRGNGQQRRQMVRLP